MTEHLGQGAADGGGRGVKRWRIVVWGGAAGLWLLPLLAMGLDVDGVDWGVGDFVVFGMLLLAACVGLELALGLASSRRTRLAASVAVVLGFPWLWAELAVGVFTDWGS